MWSYFCVLVHYCKQSVVTTKRAQQLLFVYLIKTVHIYKQQNKIKMNNNLFGSKNGFQINK